MNNHKIVYFLTKERGLVFEKGFFITFTSLAPFWLGFLNSVNENKKYSEISNLLGLKFLIIDFFRSFISYNQNLSLLWNLAIWLGNAIFVFFLIKNIFSLIKDHRAVSGIIGIMTGIIFIFVLVFIVWTITITGIIG